MADFLKNLRSNGKGPDTLTEMRELVARMESQRGSLEHLVQHADRSIGQLQRLGSLGERLTALEKQMGTMEAMIAKAAEADEQFEALQKIHRRLDTQLAKSSEDSERIRVQMSTLGDHVEAALQLREELSSFIALDGPFRLARADIEAMRGQLDTYRMDLGRLRDQHDQALTAHRGAAAKLASFEAERAQVGQRVQETEARVATVERAAQELGPIADGVAETRRQLEALKNSADAIGQKVALIDQQRDVIGRAAGRLEHLTAMVQQVEAGVARQDEHAETLHRIEVRIQELTALHGELIARSETLSEHQQWLGTEEAQARRDLAALRESVERSVERFGLEERSLEAVTQRVADLRRALGDSEARLAALHESSQQIGGLTARTEALAAQVQAVATELSGLTELTARVQAGRADAERLTGLVTTFGQRLGRVEESRPLLEQTIEHLATLGRTHEAIKDGLEQMQAAHAEVSRVRTSLSNTEAWLGTSQGAIRELQDEMAGIERWKGTLESMRQEVGHVTGAMQVIESRAAQVDEVQRRLAEVATLGSTLEDRTRGLHERLQQAEDRVVTLGPRLDDVGRAGTQLAKLASSLQELETKADGVHGRVTTLEGRTQGFEVLSDRMRDLAQQMDQRQGALERAAEHLERASALRQEAAEAAHALEDLAKRLGSAVDTTAARATSVEEIAAKLDVRYTGLRAAEERVIALDTKLATLRETEHQLGLAIEQAAARQGTIDALQADVRTIFELTERTASDVHAIGEAQPLVARTRKELDELFQKVRETNTAVQAIDDRRRAIDQAERRLARVDGLIHDLRSSLETLTVQKAEIDHTLEKTASLAYEARQAETLIGALREERRVSDRVRGALATMRRDEPVEA